MKQANFEIRFTTLLTIVVTVVLSLWAYSGYCDRQPFTVKLVSYDQASGNNQIHFYANKRIDHVDAWIEMDGKMVYKAGLGGYTENHMDTDVPHGRSMVIYVPYAEELPQPGKYLVRAIFVSVSGKKYNECMVTTEVRFHKQI